MKYVLTGMGILRINLDNAKNKVKNLFMLQTMHSYIYMNKFYFKKSSFLAKIESLTYREDINLNILERGYNAKLKLA